MQISTPDRHESDIWQCYSILGWQFDLQLRSFVLTLYNVIKYHQTWRACLHSVWSEQWAAILWAEERDITRWQNCEQVWAGCWCSVWTQEFYPPNVSFVTPASVLLLGGGVAEQVLGTCPVLIRTRAAAREDTRLVLQTINRFSQSRRRHLRRRNYHKGRAALRILPV